MKKKTTMRQTILALTIGSIIIAMALQAFLFHVTSKSQIRQQNITEKKTSLENMETEVTSVIGDINSKMLSIYGDTAVINGILNKDDSATREKMYFWGMNNASNKFDSKTKISAMYIYAQDGTLITNYRANAKGFPKDIYECEYDNNADKVGSYLASRKSTMLISGYYNEEEKTNIIRFVIKLYNYSGSERKRIGYMVCEYNSSLFTNVMNKYIWGDDVAIWLQPAGDIAVASTDRLSSQEETNAYRQITKLVKNDFGTSDISDEYDSFDLIQVDREDNYNLTIFALVPQSLVVATQRTLFRTFFIISVAMALLAVVVVTIVCRGLFYPVEEMKDSIVRIKNGETELRVSPIGWSEELEMLGKEFNEMLDKTQAMVKDEYEAKLLVERTEYKMLQAQINPHFLYNTLDTMRGIAMVEDCSMLSGLCQSLSAIFRYSLNMSDSMSNVQKEMAHVRNYLYVMDVRNGGSIEYQYDIDEQTLYDMLPRITIQPIVENAINHGLRNVRRKDKKLIIKSTHENGQLVISVTDNGTGMDAEASNKELDLNDPKRVEMGVSIGILNVNARLKNLFGNEYGLHIESQLGQGTTVLIKVPMVRDEEEYCYERVV